MMALGMIFAIIFWYLMVQPDVLLSLFISDSILSDGWFQINPVVLNVLRSLGAIILIGLGFMVGFSLVFLSGTSW